MNNMLAKFIDYSKEDITITMKVEEAKKLYEILSHVGGFDSKGFRIVTVNLCSTLESIGCQSNSSPESFEQNMHLKPIAIGGLKDKEGSKTLA